LRVSFSIWRAEGRRLYCGLQPASQGKIEPAHGNRFLQLTLVVALRSGAMALEHHRASRHGAH